MATEAARLKPKTPGKKNENRLDTNRPSHGRTWRQVLEPFDESAGSHISVNPFAHVRAVDVQLPYPLSLIVRITGFLRRPARSESRARSQGGDSMVAIWLP